MLKVRVIPTLLWKDETLVKGISFDSWRRVGTLLPAIRVYNLRQVDELVLLDITATSQGRQPDLDAVAEISGECFVPLTVGGGVDSLEDIRNLLRVGADKVAINSAAYEKPDLLEIASGRFGAQCVVVSIDARRRTDGTHECYSHSGTRPTGRLIENWAREAERRGAGEILLTSIDRDGTMQGYDLELIRKVTTAVRIPVIASGGAGNFSHCLAAINRSGASAVAAASIFHFTEKTPLEVKQYLGRNGIPVRKGDVSL
ncbi:MAG: HisA/HisF-related TIM barrel protein [Deltaproteobacteria bacterium]|nr:HisA/HisF-related TIM barrel protein [Deltaproteobacteria bacterium]